MIGAHNQPQGSGGLTPTAESFGFSDLAVVIPPMAALADDPGARPSEPESVACGWWTCAYYSTWCQGWWTSAATPGDPDEGTQDLASLQLALRSGTRELVTA